MEAIQQEELATLFDQALSLPLDERAAFLDEACRGDANLRRELDSLLANLGPAQAFFEDLKAVVPRLPQKDSEAETKDDPLNLSGTTIRHYRVIEKLGGGGMGVVYKAEDTRLRRTVALKFLPPLWSHDAQARQRFVAEAQAASALDHNNICTIYETGETDDGRTFIAMAHYAGETLKKKIARGPLPLDQALDYAAQVARGLARAHARGIIHRDIKPANVMVAEPDPEEAGNQVVKILDFGLAKMADLNLTQTGTRLGTVTYMSPEQARGDTVDHRTDVWSLGVMLYEMLTGERPFKGDYAEAVLYSVLNEDPTPLRTLQPEVPEDLEHVVMMCLEKDKAHRYPAMADLLADLEAWTLGSALSKSTIRHALRRRRRVRPMLAGAGLVVALALLLAIPAVRQAVVNALGGGGPAEVSLAVLPFTDLSADSTNEAYNEGLRQQLTMTLTQMRRYAKPPLRVVSADAMGVITSAAEARSTFGVDRVIRGTLHRQGEQVRLDLTLVDTETHAEMDALTLNEPRGDATFQGEMVRALEELLKLTLTTQVRHALTVGGTANSRAYDYYLKGSGYLEHYELPENVNTAIRFFGFALDEDGTFARAHAGLGEAYWRKYDQTKDTLWVALTRRHCRQAIALEDQLSAPHLTLGLLYVGTGDYELAANEYSLALALDSTDAKAYAGQAQAYERLKRHDEAEDSYRNAIRIQPDYDLAYLSLGNLFQRRGRFEEAVAQYREALKLKPDYFWAYTNLGAAYLRLNRMDDARQALERSIEILPSRGAYSNLGYIAYTEKRYRDEAHYYQQALALDSTNFVTWGNLANAYTRVPEDTAKAHGVYQRAARVAEAQLEINPNKAPTLVHLANFYVKMGRDPEVPPLLERALTLAPGNVAVMIKAAYQYERLGDRDKALTWIGKALEQGYPVAELEEALILDSLRKDPRYQQYRQQAAQRP